MAGGTMYGVVYSPTWTTWSGPYSNSGPEAQFSDSDFFNDCFQALWNKGSDSAGNQYRNDVGVIGGFGFNLIRLYNWGPTRDWNGTSGTAHVNFMNYAYSSGVKVIVPVSNYFLSDDKFAWNGGNPDTDYSYTSAPQSIQTALSNFISSVLVNGDIHPAVHSFSVGNEIDINTFVGQGSSGSVDPASRLARAIWWITNLQDQISKAKYRTVLLTIPISNADQGDPSSGAPPLNYWFQAFVHGVTQETNLPFGAVGGSGATFSAAWGGIPIANLNRWYYNSVNIYQTGDGLIATLTQYDNWQATTTNSTNWPGQQFSVNLLLTEIGAKRASSDPADQATQFTTITASIATPIKTYLSANPSSYLMGYCLYEFSDEVTVQANWGLYIVEPLSYPNGNVLYTEATGSTVVSYGTFQTVNYPVDQLFPVKNAQDETLVSALEQIFA